jgi:hypothetical protein
MERRFAVFPSSTALTKLTRPADEQDILLAAD